MSSRDRSNHGVERRGPGYYKDAIKELRSCPAISNDLAQAVTVLSEELAVNKRTDCAGEDSTPFRLVVEGMPQDLYRLARDEHARARRTEMKLMSAEPGRIRILAVDDHPLFREGIAGLVSDQSDMSVVAEASNGREAIAQFRAHRPDVTLMDLQMPEMNGLDATTAIRGEFPDARIIVLTTYTGDAQALRALRAGAQAYLLKNLLHKELLETIRAVHAGKKALSPEISYQLAEHTTDDALNSGEIDVLRLIAGGNANKEIAAQLSITEETVKGRVRNILAKLSANDRTHAAMIGLRRGIIEP